MTDKVQKIREEVERLRNLHQIKYQNLDTNDNMCLVECGKRNLCNELLSFIDSLQEEPIFKVGDTIQKKNNNSIRYSIINKTSEGYRALRGLSDTIVIWFSEQDQWKLVEEPVSIWHDASEEPKPNMELICVGQYGNPLVLSSNSDSFKSRYISKWAYFNDLLNLSNVERTLKDWKEMPVSEDLEKELSAYVNSKEYTNSTWSSGLLLIARHFANWQKQQDQSIIELAEDHAMFAGMEKMREQMIKDAMEVPLYSDGDFLTVDYDFSHEGFKAGDKVKLIIIKED